MDQKQDGIIGYQENGLSVGETRIGWPAKGHPTVPVRFKRIRPEAKIPTYASAEASGFDLTVIEPVKLRPGQTKAFRTGLAMEIPVGFELQIRPRSGLSLNYPLQVKNSPGTIDSDYRGEIKIMLHNCHPSGWIEFEPGTRIAQGVITPVWQAQFEEVDELNDTDRAAGGFGSTGIQ